MPKYMYVGSYTKEGLVGLLKEGGKKGREAASGLPESLGGTLESYDYAFGENDFYAVFDLPDQPSAVSAALTALSSGSVKFKTIVLICP